MRLGTLLLRNGAVSLAQLEAGLRNQVLYGGRLGTNLVELGFLDLDLLGQYLGEVAGLPVASKALLEAIPPSILALVGSELAHQVVALPLAWLIDGQRRLAVAFTEPSDDLAIATFSAHVGVPVEPYVVPELRAFYYLERHYGRRRSARYVRQGSRIATVTVGERRRTQPAGGLVMPEPLTVAPRARRISTVPPPSVPVVPQTLEADEAIAAIEAATHREQIADTLAWFGRGRADAVIVFTVRDGNALGWRGHVTTLPANIEVEQLSIPLGGVSALQTAFDEGQVVMGPPPSPACAVERTLWEAIGADPEPVDVLVIPIVVAEPSGQQVVNLVYAHGLNGAPLAAEVVAQLQLLAEAAGLAYARLLRDGH